MIPGGLSKEQEEAYLCKFPHHDVLVYRSMKYRRVQMLMCRGQSTSPSVHATANTLAPLYQRVYGSSSTLNLIFSPSAAIQTPSLNNVNSFPTSVVQPLAVLNPPLQVNNLLLQYSWRSRRVRGSCGAATWGSPATKMIGAHEMLSLLSLPKDSPFSPLTF